MSTADKPKPHTCRLTLTIDETSYAVRPLRVAWHGLKAYRLRKPDGETYVVSRDGRGTIRCECGDFIWRKEPLGELCKHGRALRALGIL